jgi:hypothetical protein
LRREIQDIVDYKEFNNVNQLFQYAMLAEKELQGRDKQGKYKTSNTYMPRTGGPSKASTYRAPLPSSKQQASSRGATAPKPTTTQPSRSGKNYVLLEPTKSASFVASIGRTSTIQCRRCQGYSHIQKDCPSQRAYIAIEDGYISTSDVEGDDEDEPIVQESDEVVGSDDTTTYMSVIVQRALSTKVQQPKKLQRHNLF